MRERERERDRERQRETERDRERDSNLVFYAHSTSSVTSEGRGGVVERK